LSLTSTLVRSLLRVLKGFTKLLPLFDLASAGEVSFGLDCALIRLHGYFLRVALSKSGVLGGSSFPPTSSQESVPPDSSSVEPIPTGCFSIESCSISSDGKEGTSDARDDSPEPSASSKFVLSSGLALSLSLAFFSLSSPFADLSLPSRALRFHLRRNSIHIPLARFPMPERGVVSALPSLHPSTLVLRRDSVGRPPKQPPYACGPVGNVRQHLTVSLVVSGDLGRGVEQILHSVVAPSVSFRPPVLRIA